MRALTKRLLRLAPAARTGLVVLVALTLAMTATYVAQGVLIARVLADVFAGSGPGQLVAPLIGVAALQVARAVLIATREAYALSVAGRVKTAVRGALTAKLLELGPGPLQRMRSGAVQSTTVDGVEHLDPLVGRFVPQVYAALIGALAVTSVVIVIDPLVGVIILLCALAAPIASVVGARWMKPAGDTWMEAYRGLYAENLDALQGMATLKAFNANRRRGAELEERARRFCADSIRVMRAWTASAAVPELTIPIGTAAAVGLGAVHAAQGKLSVAELFTILLLSRECFRPLHELQVAYHMAYSALPASREIFALLDTQPDVSDSGVPQPTSSPLAGSGPGDPPALEFDGVRFSYGEGRRPALDGLTLRVEPGEWVAVVGRSGAGKSTLVSLLLRFFDADSGSIRLGGRDITEVPLEELRARIGVVSQDTYLFHGTVRDNLLLGRPDAGQADLEAAARAARAHDFISALPQGYDTVIGERGVKLSGGERQRIAIARALLKDAPVLVLDEPTSAVDAANEAEIARALEELTRGRTTLVIAHRLSTVRRAGRIVVLDAGRVLEAGTHDELIARREGYAALVDAQAVPG